MTDTTGSARDRKEPSLGELVGRLTEQLSTLVRDEIELAKSQISQRIQQSVLGVVAFVVAGVLGFFAFAVLLAAAILGLANALPAWLAALIVAVVLLLIAAVAILWGKRKLSAGLPPTPEDAARNVKLDIDAVKQGMHK